MRLLASRLSLMLFAVLAVQRAAIADDAPVRIVADRQAPPVAFAVGELRGAMEACGMTVELTDLGQQRGLAAPGPCVVLVALDTPAGRNVAQSAGVAIPQSLSAQGFALQKGAGAGCWWVLGADPAGTMYGGLELAEIVRLEGSLGAVREGSHSPTIARRGIKFNIPLDARTPSYSDAGDSARLNIAEMWSMDFWTAMLDEMARHRYNVLTLWSLHPFPSMVRTAEFPEAALDDVMMTTAPLDASFSLTGTDMVRPATLAHLETVRSMPIDEKIAFWRAVMQRAHDRGIEVYLFTWNIFVWGADGKHGITASQTNPVTIDYFRASVRELLLTYPLLAGIGITAGENMENRQDELSKEQWLWRTYGEGIRDALRVQPGRPFRLIHRYHQTGAREILEEWKDFPGTLDLSFKHAQAHMYASTSPPFAAKALAELPTDRRMWMTIRNDDLYCLRWGDPAFVRAYLGNLPGPDKLAGFYMGPDGYTWGRDFLSREAASPPELVIQRQWYSFLLWGRLSYEPDLPDERLEKIVARRFPGVPARTLFAATARASQIVPLVTRFHWEDFDFQWYPEACTSHPTYKGFHTVAHFMNGRTMPGSGLLGIAEYRDRTLAGEPLPGPTPVEVAAELESHARAVLQDLPRIGPADSAELRQWLGDLEATAHLGSYYAEKIRGATELAFFAKTGDPARRQSAVGYLESAREHWKAYAAVVSRQYRPQWLTRIGYVDFDALAGEVAKDVEIAVTWSD